MSCGPQTSGHDPRVQMPVNDKPVGWCAHLNRFPMALFEPHAEQACRNHGQSLQRLSERGGLNWSEALAILEDRAWTPCPDAEQRFRAASAMSAFGQDAEERLEAKPASAVPKADAQ